MFRNTNFKPNAILATFPELSVLRKTRKKERKKLQTDKQKMLHG